MKTLTLQDIKSRGSNAISKEEPCYIIVNSKPAAVIVPIDQYEVLVHALHELEEVKDILERKREKDLTFSEVKKKMERKDR